MHHILNEYRPHQARETLRLMMNDQLDRKRKETAALRKYAPTWILCIRSTQHERVYFFFFRRLECSQFTFVILLDDYYRTCADLRKQLAGLRALEQDRLVVPAGATASENNQDVDMAPATPAAASTSTTATEAGENGTAIGGSTSVTKKNAEAMSRMMQLCDTIE